MSELTAVQRAIAYADAKDASRGGEPGEGTLLLRELAVRVLHYERILREARAHDLQSPSRGSKHWREEARWVLPDPGPELPIRPAASPSVTEQEKP